jgi:2-dehydropantoate 2-reductase
MHSDFIAGKNTELETLTNIVIKLGEKYNIPTPTYREVYQELVAKR